MTQRANAAGLRGPPHSSPWLAYTRYVREDELACLARLAEEWKFPLSPETTKRVIEFCRLLIAWNVRVNLTGARTVAEVVGEHVVDAFAMARLVPPGSSVVDVGAGGGLPGVAFAILRPDARLTMVEPRAKRVAFLRHCRARVAVGEHSSFPRTCGRS